MQALTLHRILQITGGKATAPLAHGRRRATAICSDTRELQPGCLFVAIKGERVNAHEHVPDAAAKGAIAALIEEPCDLAPAHVPLIQVANTRKAMGLLARHVRSTFQGKVIAVGGSNGKTSTKYLIHSVMKDHLSGSMSPKSFNNDIGVPMTIFSADPQQRYLVLEIGTNHPGEISALGAIARPDIAVITNIGAEHLEGFGDLAGVLKEEASIVESLGPAGVLVINGDDRQLTEAVANYPGRRITFGFNSGNDLQATHIRCSATGTRFRLNDTELFVPMLGRHAASNALAAVAVARVMGLDDPAIAEALAVAQGPEMRLQRIELPGLTILNDAYNANPHSMMAALDTIESLDTAGRRIAVMGDMLELGQASEQQHRDLGQYAAQKRLDLLICVGQRSAAMAGSARQSGMAGDRILHFADATEAAQHIPEELKENDLILIKASRGIRLEAVAEAISKARQGSTPIDS